MFGESHVVAGGGSEDFVFSFSKRSRTLRSSLKDLGGGFKWLRQHAAALPKGDLKVPKERPKRV